MKLLEGPVSITVKVGSGDKTGVWTLPKDLLTHASSFFSAALSHTWVESEMNQVQLKEDDPEAFRFFVHWLLEWALKRGGSHPNRIVRGAHTASAILKAWIIGDKLGCPLFQDFAQAHIWSARSMEPNNIRAAYAHSAQGSKLRLLMASLVIHHGLQGRSQLTANDSWTQLLREVEDLSVDIVTLQLHKGKPFKIGDNWPDYFFVSLKQGDFIFE
ncbi:MAG: hypothetical protein Q9216_003124 [Gyalolechia sp. 2 TL-2023]